MLLAVHVGWVGSKGVCRDQGWSMGTGPPGHDLQRLARELDPCHVDVTHHPCSMPLHQLTVEADGEGVAAEGSLHLLPGRLAAHDPRQRGLTQCRGEVAAGACLHYMTKPSLYAPRPWMDTLQPRPGAASGICLRWSSGKKWHLRQQRF